MIAAITNDAHGFDVVDLADPVPGPEDVVIRVAACGVCGSDIKAQPFMPPGMVMDHELGGELVAVGSAVDGLKKGMNAAVLPVFSCGECSFCRSGSVSHCPHVQYIGMGPGGGFAELAVVPARHAFPLPPELPATFAALVEPFAVGLHGVHSAELQPGEDVLIVGAGGTGLTTLVWTLQKGGARVTIADPDPGRRETALAAGATDAIASVSEAESGAYDVAIECVGRPELVQACQPPLRAQGRLVISGACAEPTGARLPSGQRLAPVLSRDSRDHAAQQDFQILGAVDPCDAVREPEQEPAKKRDHGESLFLHKIWIGLSAGWLHLGHRGLTDRHELI
jgi:(R,R)-butanediol dehydrogenase/meso-butanediol dehydrogenase/diacetyl reductase